MGNFEKRERLPALQFSCCFMYFFAFGAMHFLFLLDLLLLLSRGFRNMFTGKLIKDGTENKRN